MAIRDAVPMGFQPVGLSDAVDQSSSFPGSCQIIKNQIFDRVNRGSIVPRPAVTVESSFTALTLPGVISVMFVSGTLIYGLVASNKNPGKDEPFCYDTAADAFIPVTGVTSANVPTSPPITGNWIPPTMAAVGVYVVVTHQGFTSTNMFGWFNVNNPAAPTWNAGNTTVNLLPSKPLWVFEFFGRAYFGIDNAVFFTDSLLLSISNANFAAVLTLGDKSISTGVGGLPMSQTSGAVLQSIIVFKSASIWQISGDITLTTNPLSLNRISTDVGCIAPRTIQNTPLGCVFIGTDAPRIIGLNGAVSYLNVRANTTPDIVAPFSTATYPSRMVGSYSNSIYRVNVDGPNTLWDTKFTSQDYWYDMIFNRWNGPHTFNYHCAVSIGEVFYLGSNTNPGILYKSESVPTKTSTYTELGGDITCELISSAIEGKSMAMSCVIESTIELGGAGDGVTYYISIYDDNNNALSPATIKLYEINPLWGEVKWGQFKWRSTIISNQVFTIPWVNPVVFKKMILSVRMTAAENVSIQNAWFRVQSLGYTNA